jgi:hypothetical protein
MPIQTRATLKGYFIKGSIPTADNFAALIDSALIQQDDGILASATAPVSIKAVGAEEGLINFYRIVGDTSETTWQIKQKPTGGAGLSIGTPTATLLFIDDATGNIGIGTVTPGFPLTIGNNTLGDKISLWGQSGNHYGFGIQSAQLQIYTDIASSDIVFGYGSSGSMTETMRIKGNGNVGIGTAQPTARLSVEGSITVAGNLTCGGGIPQEGWQSVAFLNNWHNYGFGWNDAGYYKDDMGIVHLKGLVAGGLANTTIFALPAGYRPSAQQLFVCSTNPNVAGRVDVTTAGGVTVVRGDSGWVSLDGLTFRATSGFQRGPIFGRLEPIHG